VKVAAPAARRVLGCMMKFPLLPTSVPASRRTNNAEGHEGKAGMRAERCVSASPRHFRPVVCEGRYPGSRVLTCRLPRLLPSGISTGPHSLTVAGAAQAFCCASSVARNPPVSRLTAAANPRGGTLHDLFRRSRSAKKRIIACPQGRRSTIAAENSGRITNKVQKRPLRLDRACFLNL
jgi:hypothetical protein